jgi:hypothetical protein
MITAAKRIAVKATMMSTVFLLFFIITARGLAHQTGGLSHR